MKNSLFIFMTLTSTLTLINAFIKTTYIYKTIGDLDIEADVYSPTITPGQLSPVIFAIHGGGYLSGSKTFRSVTKPEIEELCSRKWTVVSINYRLIPFALFEDIMEDIQDAYNWIRNELSQVKPINPELISVFGQSAGGGLALMAGYKLVPRPKSVIAFYPYCSDFNDVYINSPATQPSEKLLSLMKQTNQSFTEYREYGLSDPRVYLWFQILEEMKGGWVMVSRDPEESAESIFEKLKGYSAIHNIDKDYPPTYLTHGLNDATVLFSQSILMAQELEKKGVEFVLDLIYGAGHGYDLNDYSKKMWELHILPAFDFAAKYMI